MSSSSNLASATFGKCSNFTTTPPEEHLMWPIQTQFPYETNAD